MVTLSRAKCPRCGFVVVAASPEMKDTLCVAHDREAHGLGLVSPSVAPAASWPPSQGR